MMNNAAKQNIHQIGDKITRNLYQTLITKAGL